MHKWQKVKAMDCSRIWNKKEVKGEVLYRRLQEVKTRHKGIEAQRAKDTEKAT